MFLHSVVWYTSPMQHPSRGLTFVEILLVVAVLGILITLVLATVSSSRAKAIDNRIRSSVSQMRILAEIAFDSSGGSYVDWSQDPDIQTELTRLLEKIDEDYGDAAGAPYVTTVRETQSRDYCVSAPLTSGSGSFYCIDATGKFQTTTAACPDYGDDLSGDPPLRCPGN